MVIVNVYIKIQHVHAIITNLDKFLKFQYLSTSSFKFSLICWKLNTELYFFSLLFQTLELISETLKRIFLIFPQFCFGYGLIELSQQQSVLDFLKAYGVEYPNETFEMDKLGAMFVALVSQGTMFFFLRLLINEWLINKLR